MTERDRNMPYLTVLVEKKIAGAVQLHAGLARHGIGNSMCELPSLFEFELAALDPNFALSRADGWRHRYAEAMLELNRGCHACLDVLAAVAKEVGYAEPKGLKS